MQIIIQTDLPPLAKQLTRLAGRLQDLTPVMSSIGGLVEGSTRRRIAEEKTTPEGDPWKPLSARTIAAKTSRSGKIRGGILVDRGNLLKSMTEPIITLSAAASWVMLLSRLPRSTKCRRAFCRCGWFWPRWYGQTAASTGRLPA